jgi:hypothetical protein
VDVERVAPLPSSVDGRHLLFDADQRRWHVERGHPATRS